MLEKLDEKEQVHMIGTYMEPQDHGKAPLKWHLYMVKFETAAEWQTAFDLLLEVLKYCEGLLKQDALITISVVTTQAGWVALRVETNSATL